jgi:RalA-binding protein 1
MDLKLRINGSTSGTSTTSASTTLGLSQTSTPGEEIDQDTLNSISSAHPFGGIGQPRLPTDPHLSEIELSAIGIHVKTSTIRPNDRGKEVISFIFEVSPPSRGPWCVEKLYSNVLNLDSKIRSMTGRSHLKKLAGLPDSKLFKDNAPAKVDQRKAQLEAYLRSVVTVPVKRATEICEFFCTDIIDESRAPVAQLGYKEGYLTKRGKNFGGWKTRYFVLQGPVLEYYENVSSDFLTGTALSKALYSVEAPT